MGVGRASHSVRCGNTWDWICEVYQDIHHGRSLPSNEHRRICEIIREVLDERARETLAEKWMVKEDTAFPDIANREMEINRQRDCVEYLMKTIVGEDPNCQNFLRSINLRKVQ